MKTTPPTPTRRQVLRTFGAALGGAAVLGANAGFTSTAHAANGNASLSLTLDRPVYRPGELITLVIREDFARWRRTITVSDTGGSTWTRILNRSLKPGWCTNSTKRGNLNVKVVRNHHGAGATSQTSYHVLCR